MSYSDRIRPILIRMTQERMELTKMHGAKATDPASKQAARDAYKAYRNDLAGLEKAETAYRKASTPNMENR